MLNLQRAIVVDYFLGTSCEGSVSRKTSFISFLLQFRGRLMVLRSKNLRFSLFSNSKSDSSTQCIMHDIIFNCYRIIEIFLEEEHVYS